MRYNKITKFKECKKSQEREKAFLTCIGTKIMSVPGSLHGVGIKVWGEEEAEKHIGITSEFFISSLLGINCMSLESHCCGLSFLVCKMIM